MGSRLGRVPQGELRRCWSIPDTVWSFIQHHQSSEWEICSISLYVNSDSHSCFQILSDQICIGNFLSNSLYWNTFLLYVIWRVYFISNVWVDYLVLIISIAFSAVILTLLVRYQDEHLLFWKSHCSILDKFSGTTFEGVCLRIHEENGERGCIVKKVMSVCVM